MDNGWHSGTHASVLPNAKKKWPSNETAPRAPGVLECRPQSIISIDSIHLYACCWSEKIDAEHLHIEQFAWEFDLQLRAQWKASHVRVQASRNHVEYSQVDQDISGCPVSLDVRQLPWPTEDLGPRLPTCWEPICECWRYNDTRTSYNKPYHFPKKKNLPWFPVSIPEIGIWVHM